MARPRIVLASASPRRATLLRQLRISFEQVISPEPELLPDGHSPADFVRMAASAKARAVYRLGHHPEPAIFIGADTIVVLDGNILGKPDDPGEAVTMLSALSGRTHQVFTGVAVIHSDDRELQDHVITKVRMRPLGSDDIAWYVASGEPLDKAGAYGIQGLGARFIEHLEGCYYNVVGLPLARLTLLLERAGYPFAHSAGGWSITDE